MSGWVVRYSLPVSYINRKQKKFNLLKDGILVPEVRKNPSNLAV